jgi:hypothetical protein
MNGLDEDEGGDAISSTYCCQQKHHVPQARIPLTHAPKPNITQRQPPPHPEDPTRGTGPPQSGTGSTSKHRAICQYCGLRGHGEQE